jgi:UDP-glucose 4-epimerase
MKLLVTGGAGYIGSVTVEALRARGDQVVVVDNLSTGHRAAVDPTVPFYRADLLDTPEIQRILDHHAIDAVLHFAASSIVGESVVDPAAYLENNVCGTASLLRAMLDVGVKRLVFSSTAAVYGEPSTIPIVDDHPIAPTSPYGVTKAFMEQAMALYARAYGLRFVALRYFNACGATDLHGEAHRVETHLIPLVLQVALGRRAAISIFGDDYDTPDGTCVRDYVHVADLADAHLCALDWLSKTTVDTVNESSAGVAGWTPIGGMPRGSLACNLGYGHGYSVREVIDAARRVTGHAIPTRTEPRRPGDPSRLEADASRARNVLGWSPRGPRLEDIIASAWRWHSAHPDGYPAA